MKLQEQVCTLEQAKRLTKLGLENKGLVEWYYLDRHKEWQPTYKGQLGIQKSSKPTYPAFTVAELGVMLGETSCLKWDVFQVAGAWMRRIGLMKPEVIEVKTEAEARANLLIRLLENKLTTASDCNKRLTP